MLFILFLFSFFGGNGSVFEAKHRNLRELEKKEDA